MTRELCSEFNGKEIVFNHIRYTELDWDGIVPQTHEVTELIYVKEGGLIYQAEGKSYELDGGCLVITPAGVSHSITFLFDGVYERYDLFLGKDIALPSEFESLCRGVDVIDLNKDESIGTLFAKMDLYCANFSGNELAAILSDVARQIVYDVVIMLRENGALGLCAAYTVNKTVAAAVEYIEKNIKGQISVDELCKELYLSKGHLQRLFTKHMKVSVSKYINAKKLVLVQEALRSGAKATAVYAEFGFSDYSSFFRAYKKHFGYPPSKDPEHKVMEEVAHDLI